MHRRDFIKSAAITVAGLSMPDAIGNFITNLEPAIYVTSIGESRSKENRLLMD